MYAIVVYMYCVTCYVYHILYIISRKTVNFLLYIVSFWYATHTTHVCISWLSELRLASSELSFFSTARRWCLQSKVQQTITNKLFYFLILLIIIINHYDWFVIYKVYTGRFTKCAHHQGYYTRSCIPYFESFNSIKCIKFIKF